MTTKKRGWKVQAIREYLKEKGPDSDYKQFLADTKIKATDATFYKQRKKMREGGTENSSNGYLPPDFKVYRKLRPKYEKLAVYLKANPEVQFKQAMKETGLNLCNSTFARFKNRCLKYWGTGLGITRINAYAPTNVVKTVRKKQGLYKPIFVTDSSKLPESAKKLLEQFVEALNVSKVGRYEMKEYHSPRELEVREVE